MFLPLFWPNYVNVNILLYFGSFVGQCFTTKFPHQAGNGQVRHHGRAQGREEPPRGVLQRRHGRAQRSRQHRIQGDGWGGAAWGNWELSLFEE